MNMTRKAFILALIATPFGGLFMARKTREELIREALEKAGEREALAKAMCEPLIQCHNYRSLGEKIFTVTLMPGPSFRDIENPTAYIQQEPDGADEGFLLWDRPQL